MRALGVDFLKKKKRKIVQARLDTLLDLLIAVLGQRQGRYASTEFIVCFELLMMDEPYCGQCFVRAFEGKQPGFFYFLFFPLLFDLNAEYDEMTQFVKRRRNYKKNKENLSRHFLLLSFYPGFILAWLHLHKKP